MSYIGPNAVLRGDFGRIHVQPPCNIQDTCVLHTFPGKDTVLKPYSHIGHGAILHGCTIEENAMVGINAVVLDEAIIGSESIIAASSFVPTKFTCPPRSMVKGIPAKVSRTLSEQEVKWKTTGTKEYVKLAQRSLDSMRIVEPLTDIEPDRPYYLDSTYSFKQ